MTDGPTVYQSSGALHDGLTGNPTKVPPSLSAISYLPTTKARRKKFQPTAAHCPSGHRTTGHIPSGHCHVTTSCNNSALGHDPVSLSLPDPANKSFLEPAGGSRGKFIGNINQSGTSRVAVRVSVRMAPDACAATPRAPHGWLHVSVSCKVTPFPLPVYMHGLAACKETPRPPHVWPHGLVACVATLSCLVDPPRAYVCHSACCDHFY
ncbi:hypothetical protein IGI04_002658 [Brassica rapa subsp. trilocularis]|uniref:Uncharacterized protein n=1 Tax=Brassica rapa subsp. trilocularis TaxID=1813537 RepID=A0ABQ7NWX0_BRACM|nr:hypothetical protein IGI04_002658 [Brassica rapa subsp. trilocularis]